MSDQNSRVWDPEVAHYTVRFSLVSGEDCQVRDFDIHANDEDEFNSTVHSTYNAMMTVMASNPGYVVSVDVYPVNQVTVSDPVLESLEAAGWKVESVVTDNNGVKSFQYVLCERIQR